MIATALNPSIEYDDLPGGLDPGDSSFAGADGILRFLDALRDVEVSDLITNTEPKTIAFVWRGHFGIIDPKRVPYLTDWEEFFNQKHTGNDAIARQWTDRFVADYSLVIHNGGQARVHAWMFRGLNLSIRIHPKAPKTIEQLISGNDERDDIVRKYLRSLLPSRRQGLIVIGGEVRSGKTWLENALYHDLNVNAPPLNQGGIKYKREHLWIIGDPIEFYHAPCRSLFQHIDIAEKGTSQADAIVSASSQAKEIRDSLRVPRTLVATGEMRGDPASTEATINAALAGTKVVSTGHYPSLGDIVARFSLGSEAMSEASKRTQFVSALSSIIVLALYPGKDEREHLAVSYIDFIINPNLRNDLREDMLGANTQVNDGLRPMRADLEELVRLQRVDEFVAFPERKG